ncbi:MAG: hypothetical protein CBC24_09815 [Candidatus Pelagibacter sp. TMED64]|nr:hypothetical protein [Candidatus Pelagibacter sp.]OUU62746.1 MAG: hypothetical protein CBC24_09815 [Candidatus Pelagibacter sp. TMED64]|tara:strand:+ start:57 stop:434 length:378 start_codon:yes stop_codon:yes gene_type:complete
MTIKLKLNKDNILLEFMQSETGYWDDLKDGEKVVTDNSMITVNLADSIGYYYDEVKKTLIKTNELKFTKVRNKRNTLLTNSDYTQLADSTYPSTQDAWKTYRQQLRDITKGVTDPDTIVFPEEPK